MRNKLRNVQQKRRYQQMALLEKRINSDPRVYLEFKKLNAEFNKKFIKYGYQVWPYPDFEPVDIKKEIEQIKSKHNVPEDRIELMPAFPYNFDEIEILRGFDELNLEHSSNEEVFVH